VTTFPRFNFLSVFTKNDRRPENLLR
jgi:hypothetical protein